MEITPQLGSLKSIIDFLQCISQHVKNVRTRSTGVLAEERIWQQVRNQGFSGCLT